MTYKRLVISTGFAIFAMFFGAGNLVFPLATGVHAGHYLLMGVLGFVLSGVLIPTLGLFAISLYRGHYMDFLAPIGRMPAFVVALLLIVLVGLVVGTPRTSILAYGSFRPFFPYGPQTSWVFNAIFFLAVLVLSLNQRRIVDLLGYILSPIKLLTLLVVIIAGFFASSNPGAITYTASYSFTYGLHSGYGTMDLLASFFFCTFVYQVISYKTQATASEGLQMRLVFIACVIGASLLSAVYLLFIIVANRQGAYLQHVATEALIGSIAKHLLGGYAAIFVSFCVTLACLSTALAVNAVTVSFFQTFLLAERVPYIVVLVIVTSIVFVMSNFGFLKLMSFALPILSVLYPALLALTIANVLLKLRWVRYRYLSPVAFYGVLLLTLIQQ